MIYKMQYACTLINLTNHHHDGPCRVDMGRLCVRLLSCLILLACSLLIPLRDPPPQRKMENEKKSVTRGCRCKSSSHACK